MRINTISKGYVITIPELVGKIFSENCKNKKLLSDLYSKLLEYQKENDVIIDEFTVSPINPISNSFELKKITGDDVFLALSYAITSDDNDMKQFLSLLNNANIDYIRDVNFDKSFWATILDYIVQVRDYGFVSEKDYITKKDKKFYFVDEDLTITNCVIDYDIKKILE